MRRSPGSFLHFRMPLLSIMSCTAREGSWSRISHELVEDTSGAIALFDRLQSPKGHNNAELKGKSGTILHEKAKIGLKDPIHGMIFPKITTLDCQASSQIGIPCVLQQSLIRYSLLHIRFSNRIHHSPKVKYPGQGQETTSFSLLFTRLHSKLF
jgi:hypothetical protein